MKRRNVIGDDLDKQYLEGDNNYLACIMAAIAFVFTLIIFWPTKG